MKLLDNWKNAFGLLEAEGMAVLHEVEAEVTSFLDRLKQYLIENPEPVFAVLRRVQPILLVENFALVTRFEDLPEVLSRGDVISNHLQRQDRSGRRRQQFLPWYASASKASQF
jgi:hypothetical protein